MRATWAFAAVGILSYATGTQPARGASASAQQEASTTAPKGAAASVQSLCAPCVPSQSYCLSRNSSDESGSTPCYLPCAAPSTATFDPPPGTFTAPARDKDAEMGTGGGAPTR